MTIGRQTWDAKGKKTLDFTTKLTRLRWTYMTSAGEEDSITLPDIAGKKGYLQVTPMDPDYPDRKHSLTREGDTLTWELPNAGWTDVRSILSLFLYT